MRVIAIVNQKGGCAKTTLHIVRALHTGDSEQTQVRHPLTATAADALRYRFGVD